MPEEGVETMSWLREAATDSNTSKVSSKRVCMLTACFTLSLSTLMLTIAACFKVEVSAGLGIVAVPLAGLGGFTYINTKKNELNAARTPE